MKNITQTALELGVSRKRIYNEIKRLNIHTQKDGKNTYISDDDYKHLLVRVTEHVTEHVTEQTRYATERTRNIIEHDRNMIGTNISDREYTDLKERIRFLEEQINIKDQQIQTKDNQINGLIQTNLNLYKALNPPDQEIAVTKSNKPRELWIKKLFKR